MQLNAKSVIIICSLLVGCTTSELATPISSTASAPAASQPEAINASTASAVAASQVAQVASTPAPEPLDSEYSFSQKDINALILNAYNEARGESDAGVRAVLRVTMARVESACYPDTVHGVVYQRNQFSWTKQRGAPKTLAAARAEEPGSYARVKALVNDFIEEGAPASNAVLYHARSVRPSWSRSGAVERCEILGSHIFYALDRC